MVEVLVIGGGGSALSAALGAVEAGASVTLVEKEPVLGGTTGMSIGSITASGTRHQRRAGVVDGPEQHFDDMDLYQHPAGSVDDRTLRRLLTDNVATTLEWLEGMGLVFHGPSPEPPHRSPRMHNVLPDSRAYIRALARECRKRGVEVRTGLEAERLLTKGRRVIGAEVRDRDGKKNSLTATRAVVLATGDYSNSAGLRARFLAPAFEGVRAMNPGSTGTGHELALALGARVLNASMAVGPEIRFPPPSRTPLVMRLPPTAAVGRLIAFAMRRLPRTLLRPFIAMYMTARLAPSLQLLDEGAILVNRDGEIIDSAPAEAAFAVAAQPEGVCYFLFDDRVARVFEAWPNFLSTAPGIAYAYLSDYRRYRPEIVKSAQSLEQLANLCGMQPDTLVATARSVGAGGKALIEPPFTALGPAPSWIMTTEGGLAVSGDLEVLDAASQPIPGLFAAGSVGQGGLQIPGHGHHLGWAFTSGRLAGRNAAAVAPETAA